MTECDQPIIITTPIAGPYIKKLTYAPVVNDTIFSLQYNIPPLTITVPSSIHLTSSCTDVWPFGEACVTDGSSFDYETVSLFSGYDINEVFKVAIDPTIEFEVGVGEELNVLTQMPAEVTSLKLTKFDFTNATISLTDAFSYDFSDALNTLLAPIANDGITFSINSEGVMDATIPIGNLQDSFTMPVDGKFSLTFDMDLNFGITLCIAEASFGVFLTIDGTVAVSSTSVALGEITNDLAGVVNSEINTLDDALDLIGDHVDDIPTSNTGTLPAFGFSLTASVSVNMSELVGG